MDASKLGVSNWNVTWGTTDLGLVDAVGLNVSANLLALGAGTMGPAKLDDVLRCLEGTIDVQVRELDHTMFEKLVAWNQGSVTASLPLMAGAGQTKLYQYAQKLTLHPTGIATNVTSLDWTFLKTVPILKPASRDGIKQEMHEVSFLIYPDRTQLPNLVYGYVGPQP